MAVRHLNYLDLSPVRRAKFGNSLLADLRRSAAMPGLNETQRQEIEAKIAKVKGWIDGTHPRPHWVTPKTTHTVVVSEALEVTDVTRTR